MSKKPFPTKRFIKLATGVCLIYTGGAWGIYSQFIMENGWILNHLDVIIAGLGIFFVLWAFKRTTQFHGSRNVKADFNKEESN